MRGIINGLLLSAVLWCGGCVAYKQAYVAVHDAIDEALADQPAKTNAKPDVVFTSDSGTKPSTQPLPACQCDLAKPAVWPLKAIGDKATVDATLGANDGCGDSGRRDCRAMLMRPDGNCWGYKYLFSAGCLQYSADFNQVSIRCVEFRGQAYHFVGWSTQESISTMTRATPGEWLPYKSGGHGMFLFFEARDK